MGQLGPHWCYAVVVVHLRFPARVVPVRFLFQPVWPGLLVNFFYAQSTPVITTSVYATPRL
jgi:hypothetical protein